MNPPFSKRPRKKRSVAAGAARWNVPAGSRRPVLVIGSSNTDMIIKVARVPKGGETILGGQFATASGGKGANQAVAAARAGAAVTFIARVGRDVFGEQALTGFVEEGIRTDFVVPDSKDPSGVALIFVGDNGENSIAVASGANGKLSPQDLRRAAKVFRVARVLLVQLETPLNTVETAIAMAAASGVRVILNPAPAQPLPARLLKQVFLLTPNESESELLTGVAVKDEASAGRAAEILLRRGVANVIITMGARGALVAAGNERHLLPAYKVKAVDTTGAGDVFNGTLAVAIADGKSLLEAARFASAAAAISVTRMGAQPSAPERKEIEQLLATGKIPRAHSRRSSNGEANGWTDLAGARRGARKFQTTFHGKRAVRAADRRMGA